MELKQITSCVIYKENSSISYFFSNSVTTLTICSSSAKDSSVEKSKVTIYEIMKTSGSESTFRSAAVIRHFS